VLFDAGEGLKRIARRLTNEGALAPKPFARRDGLRPVAGWSPSTIRAILNRELYRGVVVWNRSRKRPLAWGHVDQRPRPASEWIRSPAEHLRIIDEARRDESPEARTRCRVRVPSTPTQPTARTGLRERGYVPNARQLEPNRRPAQAD